MENIDTILLNQNHQNTSHQQISNTNNTTISQQNINYLHLQNKVKAYYLQQQSINNVNIKQNFSNFNTKISQQQQQQQSQELMKKDITNLILSSDDSRLWLSPEKSKFPHQILIDLSNASEKPTFYRFIGIYCWHSYNSNPSQIRISVSLDNKNYVHWQTISPELRAGPQIFKLKNKICARDVNYIRLDIMKTYGSQQYEEQKSQSSVLQEKQINNSQQQNNMDQQFKVYLNQVMLFENYQEQSFTILNNKFQQNIIQNHSNSNIITSAQSNQDMISIVDYSNNNYNNNNNQQQQQQQTNYIHNLQKYLDPSIGQEGRTIETQFEFDNPLSYQNSVDSSYIGVQNNQQFQNYPTPQNNNNNPSNPQSLQLLESMLLQLDELQQQSFDQFNVIKQLKNILENKPAQQQNQDFIQFFNGIYNAYQSVQQQMITLQNNINQLQNRIQYSHSQYYNQYPQHGQSSTIADEDINQLESSNIIYQNQQQQQQQNILQEKQVNLNGTSTFRNQNGILDKEQLVSMCMEQCKEYIMNQLSGKLLSNNNQQVKDKENKNLKSNTKQQNLNAKQQNLQQSQKFEKSLERRIDKFIASQHKARKNQEQDYDQLYKINPTDIDIYKQSIDTSRSNSQLNTDRFNKKQQQKDVQKIAQELQQKLAIKAKKLQELQDREESKITLTTDTKKDKRQQKQHQRSDSSDSSEINSDNSSVISNCSSLLKLNNRDAINNYNKQEGIQNNYNQHRIKDIQMPQTIKDLSKIFQYDNNGQNLNNLDQEDDELLINNDSKLEQYFISSHRDSL